MTVGGAFIRFGGFGLRILQFCIAAIGLGIFSYFLAVLADRSIHIEGKWIAVEALTGAATLYALLALGFVLCLGGVAFFGYLALLIDILFVGANVVVAYYTRRGANSCTGYVNTPLGSGDAEGNNTGYGSFGFGNNDNSTYFPKLHTACVLNTVVFATAIINIFLFLVSAVWNILMVRHHKKEKAYGPSPANNYTSGSGKTPFWKRNRRAKHTRDAEAAGAIPAGTHPSGTAVRPSGETGTTFGNNDLATEPKYGEAGYGHTRNF